MIGVNCDLVTFNIADQRRSPTTADLGFDAVADSGFAPQPEIRRRNLGHQTFVAFAVGLGGRDDKRKLLAFLGVGQVGIKA